MCTCQLDDWRDNAYSSNPLQRCWNYRWCDNPHYFWLDFLQNLLSICYPHVLALIKHRRYNQEASWQERIRLLQAYHRNLSRIFEHHICGLAY